MSHLLISAAHKSSGKTTIAMGLCALLRRRGLTVQPFKKGPDYIDPMWLTAAAGRSCRNLDFNTMTAPEIQAMFADKARDADIAIIEGNKGLYDGVDLDGANSNAALAALVHAPVVLVIDTRGMTRGIAPLLLGYQSFEPGVPIAGVILNQVGGPRHEAKLRDIVAHYTDLPVLGAVQRDPRLAMAERHLGLVPAVEADDATARIDSVAEALAGQVDIDRLLSVAGRTLLPQPLPSLPVTPRTPDVRIGIARDSAFSFYYPDDLEALERAGATLVPIDTLRQPRLPDIDGLLIGGGFPETHLDALEANASLRADIRAAIEAGLPTYAECGGLIYLARTLTWRGRTAPMVGVIRGDVVMHDRPTGRGYVRLRETGLSPWPQAPMADDAYEIAAHEFHYSSLRSLDGEPVYAYDVLRGSGIDGRHDGLVYKNLLASYAHLRDVGGNGWTRRFVALIRAHRNQAASLPRRTAAPALIAVRQGSFEERGVERSGCVYLVGAGPGDPDLLTVKALRLLQTADAVVYDRLVSEEILDLVPETASRIFAGKAARNHHMPQERINELLVDLAKGGRTVVRLKGGDPFIFGRGSEEALHLVANGIRVEVVPGISASSGCAAYAGIPLTHRGVAKSVRFITGHAQDGKELDLDWASLADPETTLVIYMGLINADRISRQLIRAGLPGYTPAAAIEKGTTAEQRTVLTTVAELPDCVVQAGLRAPTLLVVGEVVNLAEKLSWRFPVTHCDIAMPG